VLLLRFRRVSRSHNGLHLGDVGCASFVKRTLELCRNGLEVWSGHWNKNLWSDKIRNKIVKGRTYSHQESFINTPRDLPNGCAEVGGYLLRHGVSFSLPYMDDL
jgi:hypothetical protein